MRSGDQNELTAWFRGMMQGDLRTVLRIEADSFAFPWSERDFLEHLNQPESVALVVECGSGIIAYMVFGFDNDWIRVYSCVVAEGYRRHGIGTTMVARLLATSAAQRRTGVSAKVPERNLTAQLFFRSCGFRAMGVLPDHLFDGQDVYVMQSSVSGALRGTDHCACSDDVLLPVWEAKHA